MKNAENSMKMNGKRLKLNKVDQLVLYGTNMPPEKIRRTKSTGSMVKWET